MLLPWIQNRIEKVQAQNMKQSIRRNKVQVGTKYKEEKKSNFIVSDEKSLFPRKSGRTWTL